MKFNFSTTFSHFKPFGLEGNPKTKMGPKKVRVAAKNASKKAKKDVEAEEEEDYTPSTDSGGEDDTSEDEEEEASETIDKVDSAATKRNEDSPKKRAYVRKTKEVLPTKSNEIKPPKKFKKIKRDRPNTFMTMENFKEGNEVVLTPAKKYQKIVPLRVFLRDDRVINFMYNRYYHNNQWITTPACFFSNLWQADPKTIRDPANDNGKRETNAKFGVDEVPYIRDAMQLIMDTNPDIYKNMHVEPMPGIEFLKRVEAVQNNIETPAEYVHVD